MKRLLALMTLILIVLSTMIPARVALAANGTTIGSVTSISTFVSAGVIVSYTGDDDQDGTAVMQYRAVGSGTWLDTHPMYCDRTDLEWRGSILWLEEDTDYEIQITFTDADGVTGTNPATDTFTTMDSNPPSTGENLFVSTTGNDSTGDGSIGNPWRTIQYGVNQLSAGDILNIRAGTYDEMVTASGSISGTLDNYITIQGYNSENVTIDGESTRASNLIIQGDYIKLSNITFKDSYGDSGVILESASVGVIADDITIENPNRQGTAKYGFEISGGSSDVLLQNSLIIVNEGPAGLRGSIYGVGLWNAGGRITLRNNYINGVSGVSLRDGICDGPEDDDTTGNNWDFYNNEIVGAHDDGLQLEGGGINCRVWGNTITNSYVGIAFCPILEGPAYIFRNVVFNNSALFTKMGDSSFGRVYFYHNTHWTAVGQGWSMTNAQMNNIVSKNNIVRGGRYAVECGTISTPYELDYNSYYSFDATRLVKWTGQALYTSLTAWRTAYPAIEPHGRQGEPGLVQPVSQGVILETASPCIDAGITLTQFNDSESPWPYLDGAPDIGAKEYDSGAPPNHPPVLAVIGWKAVYPGSLLEFQIQGTDVDGDPLTYAASNLPSGATFNPTFRTFSWTPTIEQVGVYSNVHFEVRDYSTSDYENITISVPSSTPENHPPTLNPIGNKTVQENTLLQFTVNATDPDADPLTYGSSNLPYGATFNPDTRVFSWLPAIGDAGVYPGVRFSITDGEVGTWEEIIITVTEDTVVDVFDTTYLTTITFTNNGTAATDVFAVFDLSTGNMIAADMLNDTATDASMKEGAADTAYQASVNATYPWCSYVSTIPANSTVSEYLYSGGSFSGKDRYFPGDAGMSVDDDATLECSDNFTITIDGYVDTSAEGAMYVYKPDAFILANTYAATNQIAAFIIDANYLTPSAASGFWTNSNNTYDDNTGTYANVIVSDSDPSGWGYYITLNAPSATLMASIRFWWAREDTDINSVEIDVYDGSSWTNVYTGLPATGEWVTDNFTMQTVTQARMRAHNTGYLSNKWVRLYEFDFRSPTVAGVNNVVDGDNTIIIHADGTHFWLSVGSENSATSLVTSIPDTAGSWTFVPATAMPYVNYIEIQVDGEQAGYWEWEYAETFTDQSGKGNTATPTFRTTSSDADVSAVVTSQSPLIVQPVPTVMPIGGFTMIDEVPEQPASMYGEGGTDFPGGAELETLANNSRLPTETFTMSLAIISGLLAGMAVFGATHKMKAGVKGSLLLMCFTIEGVWTYWYLGAGVLPGWVLIPFGFISLVILLWRSPYSPAT
jgi:hypothetical protein